MDHGYVIWFADLSLRDVGRVGGKNASLGEMIANLSAAGVRVPDGFATTAQAYRDFLQHNGLDARIAESLAQLDTTDVAALERTGAQIRKWISDGDLQPGLEAAIRTSYQQLMDKPGGPLPVVVRSSATAEDLPDASFAGQQETALNVNGIDDVLSSVKYVFASLYNDRAISYRVDKGYAHTQVALSAGIQHMVCLDAAASGVMFTIDTESGFEDVVFITSAYGQGELVVQGEVNPDEFYVHKPILAQGKRAVLQRTLGSKAIRLVFGAGGKGRREEVPLPERRQFSLTDAEVEDLARQAVTIERHYGRPMDIEWVKDAVDGKLYIVQARPETVKTQARGKTLRRHHLKGHSAVLVSGRGIGQRIGSGTVRLVAGAAQMGRVRKGDVLVTDLTDPDWEPIMKLASAIVTNRGGRTCHAAIVAREMGIPAVVGCGNATEVLQDAQAVTVSCAEGDTGLVYEGALPHEVRVLPFAAPPAVPPPCHLLAARTKPRTLPRHKRVSLRATRPRLASLLPRATCPACPSGRSGVPSGSHSPPASPPVAPGR